MRAPHKPLLLLWLFGQFAATDGSAATCQQAEMQSLAESHISTTRLGSALR
jgi:hypothetical protein